MIVDVRMSVPANVPAFAPPIAPPIAPRAVGLPRRHRNGDRRGAS